LLKKSAATNMINNNVDSYERLKWTDTNMKKLNVMGSTSEKTNYWFQLYWAWKEWDWKRYNVEFKKELWDLLVSDYEQIILEYNQSQHNAASSDLSSQLKKIRWVLEQVKTTIKSSGKVSGKKELWLEYRLRKIADKQCVR
jgi:hypothetical protein